MSFITDFFKHRGWLGIASYARDSNNNIVGFRDLSGNQIVPKSMLWTDFLALTPADVADKSSVYVYDKQCLFIWNALASRWFHVGGRLVFDDFTLVPAASAKWDGLKCWVKSGIGIGGAEIEVRLVGANWLWRYTAGRAVLDATTADILHTAPFNVEKLIRSILLPRNNGKNIMQDGDKLTIRSVCARTLVATNVTRSIKFGANTTPFGTVLENYAINTTKTAPEYNEIIRVDSTHLNVLGPDSTNKWIGSSSSDVAPDRLITNMDGNDLYLNYTLVQSADTNEGVKLRRGYDVQLIHTGG